MRKIINLIIIIFCVLIITGCSAFHVYDSYVYNDTNYSIGNKVFHSEINTIDVDWRIGNVYVVQSTNHEFIIREEVDINAEDKYKMHYCLFGDVLDIKFCGSMDLIDYKYKTKDLYIFLPSTLNHIEITNGSSDVNIENVEIKYIDIINGSGDIMLTKVTSDNVAIDNKSGEIIILDTKIKELDINTFSGNVGLSFLELPTELEVTTTSAKVVIYISDTQKIKVEFETVSGELESKLDYQKEGNEYIFGPSAISFVSKVEIETISGNVKVCRK